MTRLSLRRQNHKLALPAGPNTILAGTNHPVADARTGQFNAYDSQHLKHIIAAATESAIAYANGQNITDSPSIEEDLKPGLTNPEVAERNEAIVAAFENSKRGNNALMDELLASVSEAINEGAGPSSASYKVKKQATRGGKGKFNITAGLSGNAQSNVMYTSMIREGSLLRQFFMPLEPNAEGDIRIDIPLEMSNTPLFEAVMVAEQGYVQPQFWREDISRRIPVFQEMAQGAVSYYDLVRNKDKDLMQVIFDQLVRAMFLKKDRGLYKFIKDIPTTMGAKYTHEVVNIPGSLTPTSLHDMITTLETDGIKATTWLMGRKAKANLVTSSAMVDFYTDVDKYDLWQTGVVGHAYGLPIVTDPFETPKQKVIENNDIMLFTEPDWFAGHYASEITAKQYDLLENPVYGTASGWATVQLAATYVANGKGIVMGRLV